MVVGRLGRRVAEFEPWRLPRTLRRRERWLTLSTLVGDLEVELVREIPDKCTLSCLHIDRVDASVGPTAAIVTEGRDRVQEPDMS